MAVSRYSYNVDNGEPYMIEFCQNCQKPDCEGICDDLRNCFRRHHGLPEIKTGQHKDRMLRPEEDWHQKGRFYAYGEWHTLAYWARKYGIAYCTVYGRIYGSHMTLEKALTTPLKFDYRKARRYEIDGVSHTIREWSGIYGVPIKTIRCRLASGWDYRRAITEPINKKFRRSEE